MGNTTIDTPLGLRARMDCGEVTVPTYYGIFSRGDKAELIRRGYPPKYVRRAVGIRTNGLIICLRGPNNYYSEHAAK